LSFISDPGEIEKKSFEIIEGLLSGKGLDGPEKDIVMRVVHATADPDFAESMVFSEGAAARGIKALAAGCGIVTDVKMLMAGISVKRPGIPRETTCHISDPDILLKAKENGGTRAAAAMRKAAYEGRMDGAIVAIGNAPTALYEVIRLVRDEGVRPALIVGVPVGFVGAAESKDALMSVGEVPYITNRGRKGGSPVAAAIVNAMIKLALKMEV
jgi:precorrin-8X/cobalt-precorrin-8 methylmutase